MFIIIHSRSRVHKSAIVNLTLLVSRVLFRQPQMLNWIPGIPSHQGLCILSQGLVTWQVTFHPQTLFLYMEVRFLYIKINANFYYFYDYVINIYVTVLELEMHSKHFTWIAKVFEPTWCIILHEFKFLLSTSCYSLIRSWVLDRFCWTWWYSVVLFVPRLTFILRSFPKWGIWWYIGI